MAMASHCDLPQTVAVPSLLQRIERRDSAGTAQISILSDTYNKFRAQRDMKKAALAAVARRVSSETASRSACNTTQCSTIPTDYSLSCPACEQVLSRCHDLKKHWHDHCRLQVHEYQCKKCKCITHSKPYPKKLQTSRKQAANHEVELIRILPPKTYGCPCCGEYLPGLKEMKEHVLEQHGQDFRQFSKPDEVGQVNRLRGLLQQPDVMKELQYHIPASGCQMRTFIGELSWDGSVAKHFADRLQYGVRLEPNGGENVGIAPHELATYMTRIVGEAHGGILEAELPDTQTRHSTSIESIELGGQLLIEKDASDEAEQTIVKSRQKRAVSITGSDISEGFLRSQQGPFSPIERLDYNVRDSPVSPMSNSTRPFHLLHPIQTTNLSMPSKTKPIDSGYTSASSRPTDTMWSTIDSTSTATTLCTSASWHQTKPWEQNVMAEHPATHKVEAWNPEYNNVAELSASHQVKDWAFEHNDIVELPASHQAKDWHHEHYLAELASTRPVKIWQEQNGIAELSAAHQYHELPADEYHELPTDFFYTEDSGITFGGIKF